MENDYLTDWKQKVEARVDLLNLHQHKELNVRFISDSARSTILFHYGSIAVNKSLNSSPDVTIETSEETIEVLFQGREKLSTLPSELINISGRYKDVLFLESILYLTSS